MAADVSQRKSVWSIRTLPLFAVLALSGCKPAPPQDPPLALTELRLRDASPPNSDQSLTARATLQLRQSLQQALPKKEGARTCKGELNAGYQLHPASPEEGLPQSRVEVRTFGDIHCQRLPPDEGIDSFRLALSDERPVEVKHLEAVVLSMYSHLSSELVKSLKAQVKVKPLSNLELLGLLHLETEENTLLEALSEVIERSLKEAEPSIYPLALHANPLVVARVAAVIGALKLQSHEAYRTLAALTQKDHPGILMAAIYAFSDLKTPEAHKYLSDLAKAHPFDQVRTLAKYLLERDSQPTY